MMLCPGCEEYEFDGTECMVCPYIYDEEDEE